MFQFSTAHWCERRIGAASGQAGPEVWPSTHTRSEWEAIGRLWRFVTNPAATLKLTDPVSLSTPVFLVSDSGKSGLQGLGVRSRQEHLCIAGAFEPLPRTCDSPNRQCRQVASRMGRKFQMFVQEPSMNSPF
jgi:hypothetical protein